MTEPAVWMVLLATWESSRCSLSSWGIEAAELGTGTGDAQLEALSPFDRSKPKLFGSSGSRVVGVDAICGPPHGDFTDEAGAQASARRCPRGLSGVVKGVASDVMGELGDQLR